MLATTPLLSSSLTTSMGLILRYSDSSRTPMRDGRVRGCFSGMVATGRAGASRICSSVLSVARFTRGGPCLVLVLVRVRGGIIRLLQRGQSYLLESSGAPPSLG